MNIKIKQQSCQKGFKKIPTKIILNQFQFYFKNNLNLHIKYIIIGLI